MSTTSLASFDYLENLQQAVKGRLYKQPATALAVFRRMLTDLGRKIVFTGFAAADIARSQNFRDDHALYAKTTSDQ
jgi:hypothetical protein